MPAAAASARMRSNRSPNRRVAPRSAVSGSTLSRRASAATAKSTSPSSSSSRSAGASSSSASSSRTFAIAPSRRSPVESEPGRAPLHLGRARERRQRRGDLVVDAVLAALLLCLDPLPVDQDLGRRPDLHVAEDVRMTADELRHDTGRRRRRCRTSPPPQRSPHGTPPGAARRRARHGAAPDRRSRWPPASRASPRGDGGPASRVRLLAVPGAAPGRAQPVHHPQELEEPAGRPPSKEPGPPTTRSRAACGRF